MLFEVGAEQTDLCGFNKYDVEWQPQPHVIYKPRISSL